MRAGAIRPLLGQKRKVQIDEGGPGDIPQKVGRQIKGVALEHDVGGLKVLMDKRPTKGGLCLGKCLKARGHEQKRLRKREGAHARGAGAHHIGKRHARNHDGHHGQHDVIPGQGDELVEEHARQAMRGGREGTAGIGLRVRDTTEEVALATQVIDVATDELERARGATQPVSRAGTDKDLRAARRARDELEPVDASELGNHVDLGVDRGRRDVLLIGRLIHLGKHLPFFATNTMRAKIKKLLRNIASHRKFFCFAC